MSNARRDDNRVPTLIATSSIDGITPSYVTATNNKLDVNATVTATIDTTGLASDTNQTNGNQKTKIVDGSGNVIGSTSNALDVNIKSGSSSGTQYTDGGTPPANPVGTAIEWNEGGTWRTVSTAKPLPVTATFSPSGTQDVNFTKVGGSALAIGQQLAAASIPVILPSATITTLTPPAAITGFATSAKQDTLDTSVNTLLKPASTLTAVTTVGAVTAITNALPTGTNTLGSVKLTDGTNVAGMLKSDGTSASQNAQLTAGTYLEVSFTTTTAQAVGTTDVSNYKWVGVHVVTAGGSAVHTFQGSNDNTNWASVQLYAESTSSGGSTTTGNSVGLYKGALSYRYFRINVTAIASGTSAGVIEFYSSPAVFSSSGGAVTQSGTWTVQPGNTANTTAWKVDGSAVTQPVSGTVSITANSAVNVAQINGVTTLMGNGVTGTGSQRITVASDNTPFPVKTDQTTHGTTDLVAADITKVAGTAIVTGGTAGTQSVGGIVANNGTINSAVNPILVGGQAVSSENAANTTAKLSQFVTDLVGKLIVLPYANPENFVSGAITTAMTGTTTTSLIAAPAAGLRNYITQITVSNSHATVGTDVIIQDGSGGTTLYTIPAASVYGGAVITFPTPLRQPTTATAIFCANVTTGASTKVSASGYKGI